MSRLADGFGRSFCVRKPCNEAFGVSLGEMAPSADLGGSSKYSNENFED